MSAEQLACSKVRLNLSFDVQRGASSSLDFVTMQTLQSIFRWLIW